MRNVKLERRHFELIAATLRSSKPMNKTDVGMNQWYSVVHDFIITCKCSNGRFDSERFKKACGYEINS